MSMFPVSITSVFVSFPPTSAIFSIAPSTLTTLTVNVLVAVSLAPNTIDHTTESFASETIAPSCAETNSVPSGTLSCIYVVPSASPVFSTVIVYVIKSPTLATSTSSSFLVIILVLFALIIDVFVSFPSSGSFVGSVLSSPFAIAVFAITPAVSTSF